MTNQNLSTMTNSVVGWDIGGVNTKVARVTDGRVVAARAHPFELQHDPDALTGLLRSLAEQIGASPGDVHAVTMTAELSQMFRTKREGVAFVLDAVVGAFPADDVHIYCVNGEFVTPGEAKRIPLEVAASNWAATARVAALEHPNAILVDIGTTTSDVIPLSDGDIVSIGKTDPERLASGELVYSGALRTPVEAIVHQVPLGDSSAGVSAESFALVGDVHVWRGDLASEDYTVPTPDGRPASRASASERLARVVCADREMLDDDAITRIAEEVAASQIDQIATAIVRVRSRHPSLNSAVVTGLGSFIAARAARQAGLTVISLAETLGADGARCAPAAAVALLLQKTGVTSHHNASLGPNERESFADLVVKIGGSLLATPRLLDDALDAIVERSRHERVVIVPGGGPFADTVRAADREHSLPDETAHWMAILAMDQYAHLLASRRSRLVLVRSANDVRSAYGAGLVPVLAPYQWLHQADPLPRSWSVTSDSISAWFARALGAERLVLVKPPGVLGDDAVDDYFSRALSPSVSAFIIPAGLIREALSDSFLSS
jgi:probable H4MPT-linked C1 transfer pathway protein